MIPLTTETIYEGFVGLHFYRGKLVGVLGPGKHLLLGWGHWVLEVDQRPRTEVVGGQEVSTEDGGTFKVSLVVTYQIDDPSLHYRSGTAIQLDQIPLSVRVGQGPTSRIHQLVQVAIRDWMVVRNFDAVLEQRSTLAADLLPTVATSAALVGTKVTSIDLLDLTIAGGLKTAYGDLLKSKIEGEAALARARNEAATMRSLLNTARLVREHPRLLELRVLSSGQKPRVTFLVSGEGRADSGGNSPEEVPT